jgi:transglutaminase-like putative cysteine protease
MTRWTIALLLALTGPVASSHRARADAWSDPARYRIEYRFDLTALPVEPGQKVRVWLPYPAATQDQKVISGEIDSPWPHRMTSDALGNAIVYLEGDGPAPAAVTERVVVERSPARGVPPDAALAGTPQDPQSELAPNRLVPLDGLIRQIAEQEGKGIEGKDEKARAFYDYVVRTMAYDKSGEGWGRGDAIWACTNKRGNCTDFHSLFIGMARSQAIPARFDIGFPIPVNGDGEEIPGYHCWAEYYSSARGWLPLDASEAKKSGKTDAYFGALPNDRVQFSTGRDLRLQPPQAGPPVNYFVQPYVEVDGKPIADRKATVRFERLPGGGA